MLQSQTQTIKQNLKRYSFLLIIALLFFLPGITRAYISVDTIVAGSERTALSSTGTPTSNPITTNYTNDLILAIIGVNPNNTSATSALSNVTGGGLTWHLAKRTNTSDGSAEIWYTFATSRLFAQTITATLNMSGTTPCGSSNNQCTAVITLVALNGTATSGVDGAGAIGATNSCSSGTPPATGTPSCSVTTTQNNSLVLASIFNWSNSTAPTVPFGQTAFGGVAGGGGEYYWGQRQNSITPKVGTSVTINDTAPTAIEYNESILEVLAGPSRALNLFSRLKLKLRLKIK